MLHNAGYDVWNWEDQAILRAFNWMHDEADFPAEGDDDWQPNIVNHYYGTNFPTPATRNPPETTTPGKFVGWTDWTHP